MITRVVGKNASCIIVAVFVQAAPRRLSAIIGDEIVLTEETDSGMVFDHYEYRPYIEGENVNGNS